VIPSRRPINTMLDTALILSNTDRFNTHQTRRTAKAIPLLQRRPRNRASARTRIFHVSRMHYRPSKLAHVKSLVLYAFFATPRPGDGFLPQSGSTRLRGESLWRTRTFRHLSHRRAPERERTRIFCVRAMPNRPSKLACDISANGEN
jgi:hypothetical protein